MLTRKDVGIKQSNSAVAGLHGGIERWRWRWRWAVVGCMMADLGERRMG